ncbi:uncharacterized protein LOC125668107 isoform X3 [Ostrea edulis]|uniref:uncharacterized protein LOC125668107 isoform X3 n=1 Tax=Ostrea edulis TaxID=37623 RepID=UPI0024AF7D3A|nr:uncharacterized protein LOC125668107 isoform X3 [Ostrea edulis]
MGHGGLPGRALFLILTLYQQEYSVGGDNDLYLEQIPRTWEDASANCTLVRFNRFPSYDVSKLPTIKYPPLEQARTGLNQADLLWVGATATFTSWFELLGCFVYHYTQTTRLSRLNNRTTIGHVAECYQSCPLDEFGINKTHCICHENLESYYGRLNNNSCTLEGSTDFKYDIYGTPYKDNYQTHYGFAVYRKVNLSDKSLEDNFDECIRKLENGSQTYPCDSTDSSKKSWRDSAIQGNIHSTEKFPAWSPYLRRILYHWTNEKSSPQEGSVCVSVKNLKGSYEAVLRPCSETLPSLCDKTDDSTDISRQSSTSGMPNSTLVVHQTERDGETLPLVVGSVIGAACSLIVATVVIVIIIKKRRPKERENPVSVPTENVYYSEMTEERGASSPAVNSIDYDTMLSVREEKKNENSEEYGRLLPSGESDVYDHTWDKPITEQLTDHVYSTTCSGNDANVYDHTETSKTKLTSEREGEYGLQSPTT